MKTHELWILASYIVLVIREIPGWDCVVLEGVIDDLVEGQ